MRPKVYLYRKKDKEYELYLGEYSTLDGLKAVNSKLKVNLLNIGATLYRQYGYAVVNDFPTWNTVKDVILFFEKENEFGLIEFKIKLGEIGYLSTHDDDECHFILNDKQDLISIIKYVTNIKNQQLLIAGLLNNPSRYIKVNKFDKLDIYYSFEHYLRENSI